MKRILAGLLTCLLIISMVSVAFAESLAWMGLNTRCNGSSVTKSRTDLKPSLNISSFTFNGVNVQEYVVHKSSGKQVSPSYSITRTGEQSNMQYSKESISYVKVGDSYYPGFISGKTGNSSFVLRVTFTFKP